MNFKLPLSVADKRPPPKRLARNSACTVAGCLLVKLGIASSADSTLGTAAGSSATLPNSAAVIACMAAMISSRPASATLWSDRPNRKRLTIAVNRPETANCRFKVLQCASTMPAKATPPNHQGQ